MPNRNQTQDQQNKGRQNPGTFSPDDDEAQTADETRAGEQMDQGGRKRRQTNDPVAEIEDEEAEDDEDDADGLGARP
jgi:hypothetical protein